jgi:SAM-dependent methyltransferase
MTEMQSGSQLKTLGTQFWDANPCGGAWSSYREYMIWIRRTEPYIFDVLDGYDWQSKRVLEVGCGQGTTLNYLPGYGASVYGLDMSLESIRSAWSGAVELEHLEQIRFSQADAEHLPFCKETFDVALSIGVLHHTVDTAGGVNEIHRLLKPGGIAIVMLYRSGNPKWWMTRLLRLISNYVDKINKQPYTLAKRLRARKNVNSPAGTALLELFGVPILKAYSNRQARRMFDQFSDVKITNYQPGFQRLVDVLPGLTLLHKLFVWIDRSASKIWGFYQVIEARK